MKVALELVRILVIFGILGALGWAIMEQLYTLNEGASNYSIFGGVAILLLLFVFYRNKLQFSGWYTGKERVKLPKKGTAVILSISGFFIFLPFLLSFLFY